MGELNRGGGNHKGCKVFYDDALFTEIMVEVANGRDITEVCKSNPQRYPSVRSIRTWIAEGIPGLAPDTRTTTQKWRDAKAMQADSEFEDTSRIYEKLWAGEIKADVARVLLDIARWRTARLEPRRYSERHVGREESDKPTVINLTLPSMDALKAL